MLFRWPSLKAQQLLVNQNFTALQVCRRGLHQSNPWCIPLLVAIPTPVPAVHRSLYRYAICVLTRFDGHRFALLGMDVVGNRQLCSYSLSQLVATPGATSALFRGNRSEARMESAKSAAITPRETPMGIL